jgi:hypothetical protein
VHLEEDVFVCEAKECGAKGDVIDLGAAVRPLSLREAALDLVRRFELEPTPRGGPEKRNGQGNGQERPGKETDKKER